MYACFIRFDVTTALSSVLIVPYSPKHHNTTEEISFHQQLEFEKLCLINGYKINNCVNKKSILQGDVLQGIGYHIRFLTPTSSQINTLGHHLQNKLVEGNYSLFPINFQNLSMKEQDDSLTNRTEYISSGYFDDICLWKEYLDKGSPLNIVNECSLSFEIEFNQKYFLFCGDSDMNTAKKLLRKRYDLIKLSHHGTYHGNECFIDTDPIISDRYIISTNGIRTTREHPSRKLLSEIITLPHSKELYFNYDILDIKNGIPHQKRYRELCTYLFRQHDRIKSIQFLRA